MLHHPFIACYIILLKHVTSSFNNMLLHPLITCYVIFYSRVTTSSFNQLLHHPLTFSHLLFFYLHVTSLFNYMLHHPLIICYIILYSPATSLSIVFDLLCHDLYMIIIKVYNVRVHRVHLTEASPISCVHDVHCILKLKEDL